MEYWLSIKLFICLFFFWPLVLFFFSYLAKKKKKKEKVLSNKRGKRCIKVYGKLENTSQKKVFGNRVFLRTGTRSQIYKYFLPLNNYTDFIFYFFYGTNNYFENGNKETSLNQGIIGIVPLDPFDAPKASSLSRSLRATKPRLALNPIHQKFHKPKP